MRLTDAQIDVLLKGIVRSRVKERDGMSYVETWDIRAMMNRVFGFCGWSLVSTSPTTLVFEQERMVGKQNPKPGYAVAYKAELELIVHTPDGDARYAGSAIGEAVMPDYKRADAHDMAAKSAESGALKRAATNLGDQFGLSLYRGTLDPVVRRIVGFNTDVHGSQEDHEEPPTSTSVAPAEASEPSVSEEQDHPPALPSTDAGVGDSPAHESPTPQSSLDVSLGPDPGGQHRPAGETEEEALARRMTAVEESMKGLTIRQKIAVNAISKGEGIKAFASPVDDDELNRVLVLVNKVARGELP